jgi:hypothetical protein
VSSREVPQSDHVRSRPKFLKGHDLVNRRVGSSMGIKTGKLALIDAYKCTRAHNQGGKFGREQDDLCGFEVVLDKEG